MIGSGTSLAQPTGAWVKAEGVCYRVWAPDQPELTVCIRCGHETREVALQRDDVGYWQGVDPRGRAGDLYQYRFADGRLRPDIAARYLPQGVRGPAECIDPEAYQWQCASWVRPGWTGQSIYEIHVGTFTEQGTFSGAVATLDRVRDLGVEAIELMPVADFAGERNWGYDGVALYAPARCYGRPDNLRALVDAAHARGLAVILDVVYNHLGPEGNYFSDFCADYFHSQRETPWGRAFNLDGERSPAVRSFLVQNATYWLDEFRFDGLRLDATHAIPDNSTPHLLAEIAAAAHSRGAFVIAEDERNEASLLQGDKGGHGFDAAWADDFHHQVRVALTGVRHSYFAGYRGETSELADTLTHGWAYRGQPYPAWSDRRRGSPCDHLPTEAFVVCIENHDQIGNRARGERLEQLVTPEQFRAASLLLCLSPYPPLLFMGQEWAASSPFLFFTNFGGELGEKVSAGRRREFAQAGTDWTGAVPDPEAWETFLASKLRWDEIRKPAHARVLNLYRAALHERRLHLLSEARRRENWQVEANGDRLLLRYAWPGHTCLLIIKLSLHPADWHGDSALLQPPPGCAWRTRLHSNDEEPFAAAAKFSPEMPGAWAVWLEAVKENTDAVCR